MFIYFIFQSIYHCYSLSYLIIHSITCLYLLLFGDKNTTPYYCWNILIYYFEIISHTMKASDDNVWIY